MFIIFFIIFPLSSSSDQICYPSIFIHSHSSLPSTAPLCVVVKNDGSSADYSPPSPIQSEEEWNDFVKENKLTIPITVEEPTDSIYLLTGSGEEWKVPYSFQSNICHDNLPVETGMDITIDCNPFSSFDKNSCDQNPLSATALFSNDFTLNEMNYSVSVNNSLFNIYPSSWKDNLCINVVNKGRLTFIVSDDRKVLISSNIDRLIYTTLSSSNYTDFIPSIDIRFMTVDQSLEGIESGYEDGDFILLEDEREWTIPHGFNCLRQIPIQFNHDLLSSCRISFSSCSDGDLLIRNLLDFIPNSILDSPFKDDSTKSVTFLSPRQDNTITSGCRIATGVSVTVTHSLSGPVQSPKQLITSALVSTQFTSFSSISPNSSLIFLYSIRFIDVTPKPSHIFASPPHIDLRLPSDFFYPFLFNSSYSFNPFIFILSLLITLFNK